MTAIVPSNGNRGHVCLVLSLLTFLLIVAGSASKPAAPSTSQSTLHPELALQLGHYESVRAVAFSPDGRYVATGGEDHTIRMWDVVTGEIRWTIGDVTLPGSNAIAFSPEGNTIAVASTGFNQLCHLLDSSTGEEKAKLEVFPGAINTIAYTRDGKTLATGDADQTVTLWNVLPIPGGSSIRHKLLGHTGEITSVAFSPDGQFVVSGSFDKTVKLWNIDTGALQETLTAHTGPITSVAFSSDGKILATASMDRTVRLWNISAQNGHLSPGLRKTLQVPRGWVWSIAFSPRDKLLVGGSGEDARRGHGWESFSLHPSGPLGQLHYWDTEAGVLKLTVAAHDGSIYSVAFSPDGKMIATASKDATVKLWDAHTGATLGSLTGNNYQIHAVAYLPQSARSQNGRNSSSETIVSGGGVPVGELKFWDAETGQLQRTVLGNSPHLWALVVSPNGQTIASGGGRLYGNAQLWNVSHDSSRSFEVEMRQTLTGLLGPPKSLAISPDGCTVAAGSYRQVKVWDLSGGESGAPPAHLRCTLTGHGSWVSSLAFSQDGKSLVTGSGRKDENGATHGEVYLWSLPERASCGMDTMSMPRDRNKVGVVTVKRRAFADTLGWVWAVAFSPDGKTIVSGGGQGLLSFWDPSTGSLLETVSNDGPVRSLAFSADGKMLACGGLGCVLMYEVDSTVPRGHWHRRWGASGYQSDVLGVSFSPDGKALVGGSLDTTLKVWNTDTGRLLATFVSVPDVSREGSARPIEIGSKPIEIAAKPIEIASKPIEIVSKEVTSLDYLVYTPEGYYSGSAAADRFVRFRLGDDLFPAECFQARYYRPDLVKRALAGETLPPVGEFKGPYPPVAHITSPRDGDHITTGDSLTVELEAADDSDIKSVALFVNGLRVSVKPIEVVAKPIEIGSKPIAFGDRRLSSVYKKAYIYRLSVSLPPNDVTIKLQAIAFDDDGLQSPREEIILTRDKAAAVRGKLLGLCVGVSKYQDARLDLGYAARDATALTEELSRQRGIYSATQVLAVTDEKATRGRVSLELERMTSAATRADTVVIFLSGHGWRSDERSFYFATHEVNRSDVANTTLSWREVVQRLTALAERSKRVLVLLDACHSGSAATNEELVKTILSVNAGVMVLASSRGNEVSEELENLNHGAFTAALLEALQGKASISEDKSVTLWDFASYVRRRVRQLTNDTQHPQIPFLQDFDTDAMLVKNP